MRFLDDESEPGNETVRRDVFLPVSKTHARLSWKDATGEHVVTLKDRFLVGSAPKADVVIADPMVSRLHAELEQSEDGAWIRDLGSSNGTYVDGVLVKLARIPDGGHVRLGATEISVSYAKEQEELDLWQGSRFGPLIGNTRKSRELFAYLARIAPTDSPVLIQGETGTGKELVAQAIHGASRRASKPFVIVDCAALPENLIESELFGHAKGAFTGAVSAREGAIEAADGGTVFLDEIGELALSLQPRLLRVLESGTIRRVGETGRRKVDVRFLCATHRDLRTMVNAGAFREDLYFRLAVLPVIVPALRERLDDVPLLVQHFLRPTGSLPSKDVIRELKQRPWLGNIRELRNFVHRFAALGAKEALALPFESAAASGRSPRPSSAPPPLASDLPPAPLVPTIEGAKPDVTSFDADFETFREQWIDKGEREYLRHLLEKHKRNVPEAARAAGVDRTYIYRLIRKHEL